jgi:glyoxylase-like metal-dependent hydrolase (beta-lactamase superfamily II)
MVKTTVASGPTYHIQAFRTGQCRIKGEYAYAHYARDHDHLFAIYVTVIRGNGLTAIVDTGMESVEQMNRMAGFLMSELIVQEPGEDTTSILQRAGISGQEVDYVLLTHCHYDHCSNLSLFPNAQVVIPERAWKTWHEQPDGAVYLHAGFLLEMESLHAQGRLVLVDEGLVAPGLGVRWVGGHSPCSQFILVNTEQGVAALTGDTIQMYGNLEQDDIIAISMDEDLCRRAIEIARTDADYIVPGHDPRVLAHHPNGVIS